MPTAIRPYQETDRAWVLELLKDERTIDNPRYHLQVDENGQGVGLWVEGEGRRGDWKGSMGVCGPILTRTVNRTLFYQLIRACVKDGVDHGMERGFAVIHDKRVVDLLVRRFGSLLDVVSLGRDLETGEPGFWEVHVNLKDVLALPERIT